MSETQIKVNTLHRLSPESLRELTQKLGAEAVCRVDNSTTPHMAGYLLGINRVLVLLREGFTTQEKTS